MWPSNFGVVSVSGELVPPRLIEVLLASLACSDESKLQTGRPAPKEAKTGVFTIHFAPGLLWCPEGTETVAVKSNAGADRFFGTRSVCCEGTGTNHEFWNGLVHIHYCVCGIPVTRVQISSLLLPFDYGIYPDPGVDAAKSQIFTLYTGPLWPSVPSRATFGFSHVGIVLDDAAGVLVFSGISHLPWPCILALLHTHLSLSLIVKTSLRATQISSLIFPCTLGTSYIPRIPRLRGRELELLREIGWELESVGEEGASDKGMRVIGRELVIRVCVTTRDTVNIETFPNISKFHYKGYNVDAARTSTPDAMEVLGSDSIAPDVGMSVEKQLKNLFSEGGEAPPICYLGKKKVFTPVKEKHSRISTEAVTHINKWKVAISVGEDTCIDEQKTHTCEDDRTRSGNQKVSPLTENPSGVEEQKAKSLEAIMFGDSDDVVAEAGFENQPVELDEGKVGEVSRPTGTLTQELAEGTAVKLTVPRNEPATVLEDDKMAPSSRNVKNLMKSIFDEPSEEEEKSFGKEVGRALGDGVCVDKQQVSVEEDLFGDTDEDDGWEATDDQSESLPEGGERTCSGVFELADRDVCVEKEESMLLGDTTGVNLTSAVGQNVCADAKEGEAIRAGKLTAETLKEGKLGSDQVQNLTNCFGDAGKDDKVRSVDNTISSDIKGIGISDQQIRVGERELVKDGGEDRQQHVSEKVPSRIGEVVAEDKGTCITKHQVCNEESARSEDGQKVCENILSCVDNLLHQREDTKSPDINRMIAEFKQFFLLSPLSPDVVDEENGGDKNDCERTQVNDAGASELTTVTSVAVVHVQQLESESCVDNDNRPGSCAIEIRDVDEKHREAKETLEHDRSDLIAGKENEMEEKPSTEVCRVRRTSMRNYNQHKIINLLENSTVSKITNDLKGSLDTYFTKIMEESVRKREFEEFVRKEFTPFKNTIIETLEAIKTELTMYHDTRPKAQGGKSECSTQRVLKRKRNCAGHSRRKRVPSSSLSQKTCETMGTAFFKQSTSGRVVRNTSVDSNFPSGEEKGESGESSECGSEGETRRMKLSRKRIRRRILRSSDSSDDDYKNLKHQCEVVCKVSLENTFKSDTSKIKHTAVPVAVDEEMDETNLEGVERENINVMNNEINKQYSHEELAGTDRNLDIESEGYKMPNAKPSRIAHKGKDDFKQTLLPDDLELNLKREHLSKLLKTNTNSRPVRKVKRPSLLKRIISKCERRSKIRAVEGKETKPTRRSPRNTRACKGSEENESITNDGDKINSNAENCKEMLLSSSLECSALNGNTDRCETPMLAECPKSESTTKINESSFCNGVDECTTPSNVEDSQADLQSVRQESSLCNDTDGCVTPTFTEYYKTKLQLRHEFLACNDNTDGCRTPTFSEYYKMDVTSQKAYFSESNNINKSKTFTKEDCRKLEMQPARDSPEHSKNCGITEPFNSTLQSSGIQPSKYNGDIDGRVTPNLSDYYSEDLLPFPLQKTYGSNSNTSDGSRLDVNVGVVENLLDYVANTPRVGSQQTSSKIKSLAQLNTQVGPNSVGHLVISTNDELVSVEEGITLTNHSDRCGDHALYSNSIKTEPIKVEYDSDNIAESDMSEDDGWHLKVTPFVRSYSKKKCCTSLPIKKEVGLMQSCNRELLETNSNTTDATNIGESASEDMISVDAVANDSDSSVGSSGDGKEVVNNNIIEARVVMADPVDSSVSPVLKSRHCAAMVVSKPLSSSLMVKPSRSLNLTLPKPICSVIAPYNTCFPAAEVPKILQSTSTEKSETVHDAGAEIPKNLQGASVKEPNIVHNGAADLLQRLRSAHRKEPKSLHNAATEIANVVTHPPPKAMCSAVEMPKEIPGPSGKNCRRSHNAAANLHKQAGCGNNEAASTCLCFQDCWKNYVVRFQRRVRNDRNLKNVKLNPKLIPLSCHPHLAHSSTAYTLFPPYYQIMPILLCSLPLSYVAMPILLCSLRTPRLPSIRAHTTQLPSSPSSISYSLTITLQQELKSESFSLGGYATRQACPLVGMPAGLAWEYQARLSALPDIPTPTRAGGRHTSPAPRANSLQASTI
ncbi:hypothetical protein PR048_029606 [Dryococelus australis]|uniref:Uncharacterized protein n=1 Tax=Dryococelus australis TaxID=614101 RepID=A0ABQ9GG01_9NEOP|nr:hypothetical protein PR048_029606 [Dryococelus australis]